MTRYLLPALAAILLLFAVFYVVRSARREPPAEPPAPPPRSPFENSVAGAGIVESGSENIQVGAPEAGVVAEVFVRPGQDVNLGDPLFRLDDRSLRAELDVRQATLAVATAEGERLGALPRPEQVPLTETLVLQEQANVAEKEDTYARLQPLFQEKAISAAEFTVAEKELAVARARLAHARAQLALLKAGAWDRELAAAQAAVDKAQAEVQQVRTELERLTVRARGDARVLQVNVHPGEFVTAFGDQSLVLLGNVRELHVRVDIDENDIPRFRPDAPAVALLKGRSDAPIHLEFVRVEPFVIPKQSLTGENIERVDTRVLQVLYAVRSDAPRLYVGQQVDVFIQAEGTSG